LEAATKADEPPTYAGKRRQVDDATDDEDTDSGVDADDDVDSAEPNAEEGDDDGQQEADDALPDYLDPEYIERFSRWLKRRGVDPATMEASARPRHEAQFRFYLSSRFGTCRLADVRDLA
jgi:hypothetical protein